MSSVPRSEIGTQVHGGGGAAPIPLLQRLEPQTRIRIIFHCHDNILNPGRYLQLINVDDGAEDQFYIWPQAVIVIEGAEMCSKAWWLYRFPAGANSLSWIATYLPGKTPTPGETSEAPGMNEEEAEKKIRGWWPFKW